MALHQVPAETRGQAGEKKEKRSDVARLLICHAPGTDRSEGLNFFMNDKRVGLHPIKLLAANARKSRSRLGSMAAVGLELKLGGGL